jgi:phage terminase Nu1 subunit (DNA packaging protein)
VIPAEIVQVALILYFAARWLMEKEKTITARKERDDANERVRNLEIENASLSGALADRSPIDGSGRGWTRPPKRPA